MKVKEILERENAVSRDRKTAILIEEGGWLHAYEWSAYLLYHLIDNETDRLNPSRRACNLSKDGIIMVGFKMGSVEKYLGNKSNMIDSEKPVSLIPLDVNDVDETEADKLLSDWKSKFELVSPSRKKQETSKASGTFSESDIISAILNFNIERATLIEDVNFLSELKMMANNRCS